MSNVKICPYQLQTGLKPVFVRLTPIFDTTAQAHTCFCDMPRNDTIFQVKYLKKKILFYDFKSQHNLTARTSE